MKIEDRIRLAAHSKIRVFITVRKRSQKGFRIRCTDGTNTSLPSRRIALQFLYAIVRCQPVRKFYLEPAR